MYLIEILHQTTTKAFTCTPGICCILSKFYIKPQHDRYAEYSTCCCILSKFYIKPQPSKSVKMKRFELYLIEILHQTTTRTNSVIQNVRLYLIEILHQTTTFLAQTFFITRCILSKFYIKPQPQEEPC